MLERWETICHQWVEEQLAQGSDDEVFASGYLQGHFAVVLASLEQESDPNYARLEAKMAEHLDQARSELEPADLALVKAAWASLAQRLNG
ncbi:YfcL family protein [Ferrimonas balearica]|uniref:YfcL family protein n=1 Tax=Ferrimonas balearica TaxID=44012 RepID=UPI001C9A2341|nr:YfcL family protein [Ferrimonas balearica]MBY5993761.1 YfcL family protein [Ferrimonas balearica]